MTDPLLNRLGELQETTSQRAAPAAYAKLLAFAREEAERHVQMKWRGQAGCFCAGCSAKWPCPTRKSLEEKFL